MNLYNLKGGGPLFLITKFDADLNPEASYTVGKTICDCPAGHKSKCRHRTMLPFFLEAEAANTDAFFEYDTRTWHAPMQNAKPATHRTVIEQIKKAKATTSPTPALASAEPAHAAPQPVGSAVPIPAPEPVPTLETEHVDVTSTANLTGKADGNSQPSPTRRRRVV